MRRFHGLAFCACLLISPASSAFADPVLDISIGDATIAAGSNTPGYVDVTVRSEDGTPINVGSFQLRFTIPFTSTVLQFVSPQGASYITGTPDPSGKSPTLPYIFANNSGSVIDGVGDPIQVGPAPYTTAAGGDYTEDGSDVAVTNSVLLTRLYLTDIPVGGGPGITPKAGDQFTVTLDAANSYYQSNNGDGSAQSFKLVTGPGAHGTVLIASVPRAEFDAPHFGGKFLPDPPEASLKGHEGKE